MTRQNIFYASIAFFAGLSCAAILQTSIGIQASAADQVRQGQYRFTNPLLACSSSETVPHVAYEPLRQKLQDTIDEYMRAGKASKISIYVRDMDNGYWTGVGENAPYAPASLMKIATLIAYVKLVEDGGVKADTSYPLDVTQDQNQAEYFAPATPLSIGSTYTISQLLSAMIQQSDNNAMNILNAHLPLAALESVYSVFGVQPGFDPTADTVSPRSYMRFFRILYNGSYLSHDDSENTLSLLSTVNFKDGLTAGVPQGTTIAHKFGERTVGTERELHDCGIVYAAHPYGICIMTEGTDFKDLSSVIADLSKAAYATMGVK